MTTKEDQSNKKKDILRRIIGGEILTEFFARHLVFILFLFSMLLFRMYNSYQGEKTLTLISDLHKTNPQLKFESLSIESELMKLGRPSIVRKKIQNNGLSLVEPREAPGVVYVEKIE